MSYYNKKFSIDLVAGFIRASLRVSTAILSIIVFFTFFIPINLVMPRKLKREHRERSQKSLLSFLLFVLGARIKRTGPKPPGNIFLVGNHLGVLDVFALMAETGGRMVAKASLRKIPIFGHYMKKFGIIFIKRDSLSDMQRVSQDMSDAYDRGDSIIFFPEGTTSRGQGIRKFHGALLMPAVQRKAPVHYCTIRFVVPSNRWPIASISVCQVGGRNFIKQLFFQSFIPRVYVEIHYGDEPVTDVKRKAMVSNLEKKMINQFEPMEQPSDDELNAISTSYAQESLAMKSVPFLEPDSIK